MPDLDDEPLDLEDDESEEVCDECGCDCTCREDAECAYIDAGCDCGCQP